uniref:Transposon TX1 uncharacterized n=1 Tax=Cajanus cajan TaxID=3821 RepID=A0A151TRP5_CAJCA|nr:Transposon TX1 uncharacterized [Cajanus cajan]
MVKFDLEADRERVMHWGPWMLFDHYLIVRPWSLEFVASATKVDSTLVWIRFPGLGVMFYDESVLLTIASAIGKPVKVDLNTLNMTRGRFARACVEINLEEPVVGRFFLNGVWYNVEYEGLHLLCSSCGCYGHVLQNCPHAARSESMATGVGEKETTEQPPRVPTHSEGSAAQTGEKSDPHVKGGIAPDPHGDWMIVKQRNQKHNFGKPQGKGRFSSHNGSEEIKEQNHAGAVNAKGKRRVSELVRLHHPSLFIVLETHCQFSSVESFWRKLDYQLCYSVEATGHSGGIWVLMAGSCTTNISAFASHPQAISFKVVEGSKSWVCTPVYANPRVDLRQRVWAHLRELGGRVTLPWLVLGDFNEILLSTECRGGRFSLSRASQFLEVVNDCNLLDMGAKGLRFTWFGDRNTSFFHAQTLARRKRNKIKGLFLLDGSWNTDPGVLKTEAVRFYREIFSIDHEQESLDMHTGAPPGLGVEAQLALTAPVTNEEVRRAVMSMKSYKAPGPDGFQPFFFKQYWPIVGDELWFTVKDAFRLGFSEVSLLETQMVLIPKVDHPVSLKEFRPISLCNVAWKVISKVLVARLRPFLQNVIGPFQGSFIPGRRTRDHSIIAQEAFHFVRKKGSGVGSLAVKNDLEKAYDRVRWDFLESTLVQFGFPPVTIQLIMWGLRNSTISLLWNGNTLPSFVPSRGLRQGDPLSPYLFVFYMERLALRISELLHEGQWKPVQLSPGGLPLSHLLFADDILLFGQALEDQARLMASVLEEFSRSSGLKVNSTKSKFVSSRRVSQRRIDTLEGLLGIGHTARIGKYLGIPMTHGQPRCAYFFDVMDKIQGRLAAWKSKLLNKAGKLCLVKSTISSIPVYSMQTLWLPQAVCNRIDQACRRMLWAKPDSTRFGPQ